MIFGVFSAQKIIHPSFFQLERKMQASLTPFATNWQCEDYIVSNVCSYIYVTDE